MWLVWQPIRRNRIVRVVEKGSIVEVLHERASAHRWLAFVARSACSSRLVHTRCGETMWFTHLQLIKAAFLAVLETRSIGSTWLQRERDIRICSLIKAKNI